MTQEEQRARYNEIIREAGAEIEKLRMTLGELRKENNALKASISLTPTVGREEIGHYLFDAAAVWAAGTLGEKRPNWYDTTEEEREGMRDVACAVASYLGVEIARP